MKNILSLLTFLLIMGCANSPVPYRVASPIPAENILEGYHEYSQQKDGYVRVIIVRDSGRIGALNSVQLSINGASVAKFWPSQRLELFLMPGDYIFALQALPLMLTAISEQEVQVKSGKSYAFRLITEYPAPYTLQPSTLLQ